MSNRVKCLRCDLQILEVTARVNNGLCGGCKRDHDREKFEATVKGWFANPLTLPGMHGNPEPQDLALQVAAKQVKSTLYPNDEDKRENFCEDFFEAAHKKWSKRGKSALSEKEKHSLAVETFYGEMLNGGLRQYLYNESGAFAGWAESALTAIGVPECAQVVREVSSLFPNNLIPEDRDVRCDLLKEIPEARLESIEQPFWKAYHEDNYEIPRKLFEYLKK